LRNNYIFYNRKKHQITGRQKFDFASDSTRTAHVAR